MKLTAKDVIQAVGTKVVDSGGLGQIESIIKGVNEMLANYQRIRGQLPGAQSAVKVETETQPKIGFSQALENKRAEKAGKKGVAMTENDNKAGNNDLKDILTGLIKATRMMETMGSGGKAIGEAILEMPISVSQARAFLEKIYQSKYPGG